MLPEDASFHSLDEWIAQTLQEHQVPGAAIALARQGEIIYARGFGFRDREAELPATEETVFGTGSVTKSFTALAIMQLAEAGRLSIDAPVVRYLPEFVLPGGMTADAITIHHLLTHSSGLPPMPSRFYARLAGIESTEVDEFEREQIAKILSDHPPHDPIRSFDDLLVFLGRHEYTPHAAPGDRLSYSNEGYALLGAIVERASGRRFEEYLAEEIIGPLGMSRSSAKLDQTLAMDNVTSVYATHDRKVYKSPSWFHAPAIIPTGQVRSTALDLIRYLEMWRNGGRSGGRQILSREGIARLTAGHMPIDANRSYGYGWIVNDSRLGVRMVEHSGGHKGVAAHITYVPEEFSEGEPDRRLSCAVLTNLAGAPAGRVAERCLSVALGLPPPVAPGERAEYQLTAEQLARFAGRYVSGEGTTITINVDGGAIWVEQAGERRRARASAPDAVFLDDGDDERELRFLQLGPSAAPSGNGPFSHVFSGLRIIPRAQGDVHGSA